MSPTLLYSDFLIHVGQVRTNSYDEWGDTQISTVTTTSCYLYTEDSKQYTGSPLARTGVTHNVLLPNSLRGQVLKGDHISSITDGYGNVLLADSRVAEIRDYNWFWGARPTFFHCILDVDLDGV